MDAQREAAEAFIKSQAHEGWKLIRDHFGDGGFSGGSTERPALQRLLEAIRAGRIDIVVVWLLPINGRRWDFTGQPSLSIAGYGESLDRLR